MRTSLITTDEIMSWGPCDRWPRERIAALVGDGISLEAVIALPDLTDEDLEWFALRRENFSDEELKGFIVDCKSKCDTCECTSCNSTCAMNPSLNMEPLSLDSMSMDTEMPLDMNMEMELEMEGEDPTPEPTEDITPLIDWPDPMGALMQLRRSKPALAANTLRQQIGGAE